MIDFGLVKPGETLYVPFASFAGATGASITLTGLAVTDIEIYKDGGMTQRASDAGYTLLDTDGIDIDGITGIHGFSISLADNTTAGFYSAGSRYFIVISAVTIDGQTVNFVAGSFKIGLPAAVLNTTIATLASQTSFTLTNGPAEDDALNGCIVYIHDVASAVQGGFAEVLDYVGSTKTVTLVAGTTFTAAATDNICVMPPMASARSMADLGDETDIANAVLDLANVGTGTVGSGSTTTSIVLSAVSPASVVNNQFKGRIIIFDRLTTTTALRGQATDITAYTHSGTTMTVSALTTAPVSGDTFHIM